jgi:hypothetical protein
MSDSPYILDQIYPPFPTASNTRSSRSIRPFAQFDLAKVNLGLSRTRSLDSLYIEIVSMCRRPVIQQKRRI